MIYLFVKNVQAIALESFWSHSSISMLATLHLDHHILLQNYPQALLILSPCYNNQVFHHDKHQYFPTVCQYIALSILLHKDKKHPHHHQMN